MYLFSVAREATPIKQIIRFTAIQLQIYKINLSQQEKI
jgi:hypothetical protein